MGSARNDIEQKALGRRPVRVGSSRSPSSTRLAIGDPRSRGALTVAAVQHLQRSAGNAAVTRLMVQRGDDPEPGQAAIADPWRMTDRTYLDSTAVGTVGDSDLMAGTRAILERHRIEQSEVGGLQAGEPYPIATLANGKRIFQRIFTRELWYRPPSMLERALGFLGNKELGQAAGDVVGGGVEMASDAATGVVSGGADFAASGASSLFSGIGKAGYQAAHRRELKKNPEASAGFYGPDQFHLGHKKGFLAVYVYLYGDGRLGLVYPRMGYALNAGPRSAAGTLYGASYDRESSSSDAMRAALKNEVIHADRWDRAIGSVKDWRGN